MVRLETAVLPIGGKKAVLSKHDVLGKASGFFKIEMISETEKLICGW